MQTFLLILLSATVLVTRVLNRLEYISLKEELKAMNANFQNLADALAGIQSEIASEETVIGGVGTLVDNVVTYLSGLPALIQAAVQDAIAKGVDPAILAGLSDAANKIIADHSALAAKRDQLAAAVASAPSGNVTAGAGVANPASPGT